MIYSHSLLRNSEPFTKLVFSEVLPFVDKALVTISEKSDDTTLASLLDLQHEYPNKMLIDTENVSNPSKLTHERQKQLDKTPLGAWVLFLDGDDYWSKDQLALMQMFLSGDVDGLAVNPFQVVDKEHYDGSWHNKWFTKWFRNQKGVHYKNPWPRDLIYKGNELLYWKVNAKVPRIPIRYFHLSNLMDWRFRDEAWAKEYAATIGKLTLFEPGWEESIEKIYEAKNSSS